MPQLLLSLKFIAIGFSEGKNSAVSLPDGRNSLSFVRPSVSQLISGPVRGRPLLRPSVRQISLNGVRRHRSPLPGRGGEYVRVRALQVEAGEKKMIAKLARRVENSRT